MEIERQSPMFDIYQFYIFNTPPPVHLELNPLKESISFMGYKIESRIN